MTMPRTFKQYQAYGRFYLEPSENIAGGWMLVDNLDGTLIDFDNKHQATLAAQFARAYVKKWGDIDLTTFPFDLSEALSYLDAQGDRPWLTINTDKQYREVWKP